MKNYFIVDNTGEIIGAETISEGEKVPKDCKESWPTDVILKNPYWDFRANKWAERFDHVEELNVTKESKKHELSLACTDQILKGFTALVNKKEYIFSYDKEAQANLAERWQLFQNEMIDSIVLTARTLEDNTHTRIKVTKAQFDKIYLASVKHKEDCISRLHDVLIPMVDNSVTVKQVEDIHWDNTVVMPIEPSIIVKDDNTLDKKVKVTEESAKKLAETVEVNGMAMMEFFGLIAEGAVK